MNPRINLLLADLPDDEYERLTAHMELVSLSKGQDLFVPGQKCDYAYYLVGAIVSVMKDMPDGYSVETYMLGKNHAVGLTSLGSIDCYRNYRANVRHSGLAYRIALETLRKLLPECRVHATALNHTMIRMLMQLSQAVVCSKHHPVEQQLIRWMLITLDRTLEPVIDMTHQEVAERLGFRREAITLALGKLTAMGCLVTRRGVIEVIERGCLESLVCDCYWIGQEKVKPDFGQPASAHTMPCCG